MLQDRPSKTADIGRINASLNDLLRPLDSWARDANRSNNSHKVMTFKIYISHQLEKSNGYVVMKMMT
jgi:hypothetical protein